MALTGPGGGSDLQAMPTYPAVAGADHVVNGRRTWIPVRIAGVGRAASEDPLPALRIHGGYGDIAE